MKILHVISSLNVGGAEQLLVNLAISQARQGNVVEIVVLSGGGALERVATAAGLPIVEFEIRAGSPRSRIAAALRLHRYLRRTNADIIQTWMYHSAVLALATVRQRRRVIVTVHHDHPNDAALGKTRFVARTAGRLAKRAGVTTYVSDSARVNHERNGWPSGDRSVTIPGGVDSDRFKPLEEHIRAATRREQDPGAEESGIVVAFLGRNHPDKDPSLMLRAFARARAHDSRLRLWMIGRGLDLSAAPLLSLAEQLGIADRVVFVGELVSPERVIGAADVIAASSRTESFGLALIEGMLCGLSPAATSVGVAPKLLASERRASPSDADGLASAIQFAAENIVRSDHRRDAMSFSLTKMAERYAQVYGGVSAPSGKL